MVRTVFGPSLIILKRDEEDLDGVIQWREMSYCVCFIRPLFKCQGCYTDCYSLYVHVCEHTKAFMAQFHFVAVMVGMFVCLSNHICMSL